MERTLTNVEEEMILQIEEYEKQINIIKERMKHHKLLITFSVIEFLWVGFGLWLYYILDMNIWFELFFLFIEFWLLLFWLLIFASRWGGKSEIRRLKRLEQNILDKLAIFKVKYDPETKKVEFMD